MYVFHFTATAVDGYCTILAVVLLTFPLLSFRWPFMGVGVVEAHTHTHTHRESQLIKVFLCCWHGRSLSIKRVKFLSISCAHTIKPKPTEFLPKTVGHWFRIYNITLHNITYKLYLCLSSKAWLIGMPTLLTLRVTCMANWGCSLSVVCQRWRPTFLTMLFISRWDQQQKESKVVCMLMYIV